MAKQAKVLNDQEVKRVLAMIATRRYAVRDRAIFMLSYLAGLRAIEIASLRVSDIAVDGKVQDRVVLMKNQTKGNEARVIFVSDKLRKELQSYLDTVDTIVETQPLFRGQKGSFSRHSVCLLLGRIYQEAGIKGASSHSGRRTFATTLGDKGVGIRVIQRLLGHSHVSTTARYIECSDTQLEQAVQLVG
ncbi:MAG: tyrosine-type recombinase/integrase [Terasakiella sp.]|uniref:tyrosine-type recombinase/integrase n=1 Tax=unclassified Terasakiella TaxID=2614952 RepID=UPI003B007C7F